MTDTIGSLFTGVEAQKRQEIVELMRDWKEEIASSKGKTNTWGENPEEYFSSDGFFPGYYNQTPKVLFIEREPRYSAGDYIANTIKNFKEKDDHNGSAFTRHLLYIVQGIKHNGKREFKNRKKANDYAKELTDTKDYGFAFMNISKYTNDTDEGANADWDAINQFLRDSNLEKSDFFRKELKILEPDVIITGNLWEPPRKPHIERKYLDLCFGKIEWEKTNDDIDGKVNVSSIIINGKSVKLLNTYHLSSRYSDEEFFYVPVMKILFGEK